MKIPTGKGTKCVGRFEPDIQKRLLHLTQVRGETPRQVVTRFGGKQVRRIPPSILKHTSVLVRTKFVDAGQRGDAAFVRLENGRVFYGYPSRRQHEREFQYLADKLSPCLTAQTYLTAKDVVIRYLSDYWHRREFLPPAGGTLVEVGAYLGHKTMRFVDGHLTPRGKVLAIEVMPENIPLLKLNVFENGLDDCIDVLNCGAWKEPGHMQVRGAGRQRNSLVSIDHLPEQHQTPVPTDTLDNILHRWAQPTIDLMTITVNGAELEVLQGLDREINRVKAIYVAAHFKRDGEPTRDRCMEMLRGKGCRILHEPGMGDFYAIPT